MTLITRAVLWCTRRGKGKSRLKRVCFDAMGFILGLGYVMGLRTSMILCVSSNIPVCCGVLAKPDGGIQTSPLPGSIVFLLGCCVHPSREVRRAKSSYE